MANWTQQEMDELIAKMTKKAMTDAAFRKEVLEDATKALEKLAGRPLPEGSSLKCIEKDPNYQTTFVLPDLIDEERINDESLEQVAGGISVALIASICAVAGGVGPDIGYCAGKACAADACGGNICSRDLCAGKACGGHSFTTEESCNSKACGDFFKRT